MKVFGLVGWSGSGKTTLVVSLLGELIARGLKVSTMKHTHHGFDIDQPGKDSHSHRNAGASEVMVASSKRWALIHELRDEPEEDMEDLIGRITPVDLLLIEGFKSHDHAKMEIFRTEIDKPLICRDDPSVLAVATDASAETIQAMMAGGAHERDVVVLNLDDISAVADYIMEACGLIMERQHGAA